jgi:hypothetical protein
MANEEYPHVPRETQTALRSLLSKLALLGIILAQLQRRMFQLVNEGPMGVGVSDSAGSLG